MRVVHPRKLIVGFVLTLAPACVALALGLGTSWPVPSAHRAVPAAAAIPALKPVVRSAPDVRAAVAPPDSLAALAALAEASQTCPRRSLPVVCVDQSDQLLWVQQGPRIIFPAVRARTGRAGRPTPDGSFYIYLRNESQWSYLFNEPMPYSSFFHGDYALHGSPGDMREGPGSHGCVNLMIDDARRLWSVLGLGDLVYIWGHRPAM